MTLMKIAIMVVLLLCGLTISSLGLVSQEIEPPKYGSLDFITQPDEVLVKIDNYPVSMIITPHSNRIENVTSGHHQLVITQKGFLPELLEVDVTENLTSHLQIQLRKKLDGELRFSSEPDKGVIYVDGEYLGVTPLMVPGFPPGEYHIVLRYPEYEDWQDNLTLHEGETADIHAIFKPVEQPLQIPNPNPVFIGILTMSIFLWCRTRKREP